MDITEMFKRIEVYHKKLGYDYSNATPAEKIRYIRENTLALFQEVAELTNSLPWKPWRSVEDQLYDIQNATKEMIDCFFFLGAICEIIGITSEMIHHEFELVMANNYARIEKGYNNDPKERG